MAPTSDEERSLDREAQKSTRTDAEVVPAAKKTMRREEADRQERAESKQTSAALPPGAAGIPARVERAERLKPEAANKAAQKVTAEKAKANERAAGRSGRRRPRRQQCQRCHNGYHLELDCRAEYCALCQRYHLGRPCRWVVPERTTKTAVSNLSACLEQATDPRMRAFLEDRIQHHLLQRSNSYRDRANPRDSRHAEERSRSPRRNMSGRPSPPRQERAVRTRRRSRSAERRRDSRRERE